MKILMLTPYLPYPPSSGGQVRSYNLIKHLAKKHQITLFSLIKNPQEKRYVGELEKYCTKVCVFSRPAKPWTLKNIIRTGFSRFPFLVIRNWSGEEKHALEKELTTGSFDIIHAETFYVMPHLPPTKIPILLVDQTIEFQVYQHFVESFKNILIKPLLYIDVLKMKYWEMKFWEKADQVIAVSQADRKKMLVLNPALDVGVVPNGAGEDLMEVWTKRTPEKAPVVFFQANFTWLQNSEAAENLVRYVFPILRKLIPNIRCWIVGQAAKEKVGHLVQKAVEIIGLDNADIQGVVEAYRKATVFVAPLEGPGGTRLKILAAMAAGVPVVSSPVGIEGIDAKDGQEVLIAKNWREMAELTAKIITDKKKYKLIAQNARLLVENKYSYLSIANTLSAYYQAIANGKS